MDDYVIGIRLALDNGVSAGLAAIRADLAALDQTVAASAEGLKALSQSASAAPLPTRQPTARPVAINAPADQPETSYSPTSPPRSAAEAARPPVVRIDPPAAPTMILPKPQSPAAIPAQAVGGDAALPAAPVTIVSQTSPLLWPSLPASLSPSVTPVPQAANFTSAAPIFQPDAPSPPSRPPSSAAMPFAPPPVTTSSSPTGGDVYLDGERLGHWLASHLAREINRPSHCGADFDPSLSIAWPGASQGGL